MTGEQVGRRLAALVACAAVAACVLPAAGAAGGGDEKRPLPPFDVLAPSGEAVQSSQVGPPGQWLLVYVAPASPASIRLLEAMRAWESPGLASRAVVVIGAPAAEAASFVQERGNEFPAVRWCADPDGSARRALRITGTPFILGVTDGQIAWSLAGVLNDPRALESVMRGWVEPKTP
ncbi:MAG TPA: hypothetical protein PLN93_05940 [Vicinamibacterales bacterium]|nr:hypothetical protein [Vicinamibacterales bacterium]